MNVRIENDLVVECARQDAIWGVQSHSPERWYAILGEEFGEVAKEVTKRLPPYNNPFNVANYRTELIQLAAVVIRMIECVDENRGI